MYRVAITAYIKTKSEKDKIMKQYNVEEIISLQEFSQSGIKNLFKSIFSFSGPILIYVNNQNEKIFTSIMFCLFMLSRSFKVDFIDDLGNKKTYNKLTVLLFVMKACLLTLSGIALLLFSYIFCFFHYPVGKKKIPLKVKHALYLKSNFWISIKAGGSVGHVEGVMKGLEKNGYQISYAGLDDYITTARRIPISPLSSSSLLGETNACLFDYYYYKQLKKTPLDSPSFIYHRMSINSISALKYARKHGIPFILEYNGSDVWIQRNWGKPLLFEQFSQKIELTNLRCADLVVTISEPLREELIQKGVPHDKIVMYPNCVDPENYDSTRFSETELRTLRESLGLSSNDCIFTFIGTFGKWHGVEFLVDCLRDIYLKDKNFLHHHQVKILLIGDGLMMTNVKKIILQTPGLEKYIILTGVIEQRKAIPYLAMSDAFLSPHTPQPKGERFFGSPTKLFEYLAMEKPILAADLDQQGEILKSMLEDKKNNSIRLFEPGSKIDFSKEFMDMVSNFKIMKEDSFKNRKLILSDYTWEIHVNKFLARA